MHTIKACASEEELLENGKDKGAIRREYLFLPKVQMLEEELGSEFVRKERQSLGSCTL